MCILAEHSPEKGLHTVENSMCILAEHSPETEWIQRWAKVGSPGFVNAAGELRKRW